MAMFADGLEIFKHNEAISKQFIFAEALYLASGVGASGIKGYITDPQGFPIDGANIPLSASGKNRTTFSDPDGRYELLQIAAGIYTLTIEKTGYQTHTLPNL